MQVLFPSLSWHTVKMVNNKEVLPWNRDFLCSPLICAPLVVNPEKHKGKWAGWIKPYLCNRRKCFLAFPPAIETSLYTTLLTRYYLITTFLDTSSALTTDTLIRYSFLSSKTSCSIILLNPSIAKASMCLGNWDNYLFALFQDTGISINAHDISPLFVCF